MAHKDERDSGLQLLQFAEVRTKIQSIPCFLTQAWFDTFLSHFQVVEEACTNLLPNVLCDYLYNLSEIFSKFYSNPECKV